MPKTGQTRSFGANTIGKSMIMMDTLRERMAQNGFESNQHYDFVLRSLQNVQRHLRCLNVTGQAGRHKTAFANALARSMEFNHQGADDIIYYDFSQSEPADKKLAETGELEKPPLTDLDITLSDACAFSEASRTILILDQLQFASFKDQIRLYHFILSQKWQYEDISYQANRKNLWLFLISETELYYSLQKYSFKVWVDNKSQRDVAFSPEDFGLDQDAADLLKALNHLFDDFNIAPTHTEMQRLLLDIQQHIRTQADLLQAMYGWIDSFSAQDFQACQRLQHIPADEQSMDQQQRQQRLFQTMSTIEDYIGVDETVELSSLG